MSKGFYLIIIATVLLLGWSNVSLAQQCDPGESYEDCFRRLTDPSIQTYGAQDLEQLLENIGGLLLVISGIIAGIVIIVSGLMYMAAGSNQTRVTAAKSVFKNGVIGALIIFGFGIIINTVMLLGTDPFGFFN